MSDDHLIAHVASVTRPVHTEGKKHDPEKFVGWGLILLSVIGVMAINLL